MVMKEGRFRSKWWRQQEIKGNRVEKEKYELWQSNVRYALHQCCYFTVQIPKHKCKHMSVLSYIWTTICLIFFFLLPFLCGIVYICVGGGTVDNPAYKAFDILSDLCLNVSRMKCNILSMRVS